MISPGPCSPNEAGISMDVIRYFAGKIPIFGVCLGHQSIAQVFGGEVVRAERLMHGKTSPMHHDGKTIFSDILIHLLRRAIIPLLLRKRRYLIA